MEAQNPQTENTTMQTPKEKKNQGTLLTFKGLIIFALTLLLLIPMAFISNLVRERLNRQEEIQREVSEKWADKQTLTGPILVIPYRAEDVIKNDKGAIINYAKRVLYILPEQLNINGNIQPFNRHRSIFDVTVYQSALDFSGHFAPLDFQKLNIAPEDLMLDRAFLCFGLTDFRGIEEQLSIRFGNKNYELTAGGDAVIDANVNSQSESVLPSIDGGRKSSDLFTPVVLTLEDLQSNKDFSLKIKIKGSQDLNFTPIGKSNHTHITSVWTNPSFIGNFLPNTPAVISDSGFVADWKILYLNRNYPQVWKNQKYSINESLYGVKLLQSTDSYAKTERSVKYAILFIGLTFALYFFVEILQKRKIHPLQYALVGISLCVFYTLLLAISEYINFNYAYLVATLATVSLITLYTKSAFGRWKIGAMFGAVLGALYAFIFILIRLQDGALLFGSIGLFILLCVAMYYSRKIDWYGKNNS